MPSSVSSPEDVVNITLARLGYKGRVSNLYDGSTAAKKALDVYGQTRDDALRSRAWGFAERNAPLAATGAAAPFPWTAEFSYPADCLKIRGLFASTYPADLNNPLPTLYRVGNAAVGKVVWTKQATAAIVYTGQVTNPAQWEDPDFVEVLVSMLAKALAPVLADMQAAGMAAKDVATGLQGAEDDAE